MPYDVMPEDKKICPACNGFRKDGLGQTCFMCEGNGLVDEDFTESEWSELYDKWPLTSHQLRKEILRLRHALEEIINVAHGKGKPIFFYSRMYDIARSTLKNKQ
jgi:hypothetical protein